jgi:hypothetical protein
MRRRDPRFGVFQHKTAPGLNSQPLRREKKDIRKRFPAPTSSPVTTASNRSSSPVDVSVCSALYRSVEVATAFGIFRVSRNTRRASRPGFFDIGDFENVIVSCL